MKIFLDASHSVGSGDTGAEGFNLKEKDTTFGIVILLAKKLSDVGFDIMVSRENAEDVLGTNASTSLEKRASLANTCGPAGPISPAGPCGPTGSVSPIGPLGPGGPGGHFGQQEQSSFLSQQSFDE